MRSESITVAPQAEKWRATDDLPEATLPVRPMWSMRQGPLQQLGLVFVRPRHFVAVPAPGLIRLTATNHDRG